MTLLHTFAGQIIVLGLVCLIVCDVAGRRLTRRKRRR